MELPDRGELFTCLLEVADLICRGYTWRLQSKVFQWSLNSGPVLSLLSKNCLPFPKSENIPSGNRAIKKPPHLWGRHTHSGPLRELVLGPVLGHTMRLREEGWVTLGNWQEISTRRAVKEVTNSPLLNPKSTGTQLYVPHWSRFHGGRCKTPKSWHWGLRSLASTNRFIPCCSQ